MVDKKWLALNQHGKHCLRMFLYAIGGTDLLTTQLDYLVSKELVDIRSKFSDVRDREHIAGYCLTDLGMYTAAHYFPKFTDWNNRKFFS